MPIPARCGAFLPISSLVFPFNATQGLLSQQVPFSSSEARAYARIAYPEFMEPNPAYLITDADEFSALYGPALERSVRKQMDHVDDLSRAFIAASPLLVLATSDGISFDASPRGDAPGFVQVADDSTLLIPDRRGNNRLDSLRNIVRNPWVGLLFFVPGVRETFRVNGEAVLSRDPALTARFSVQDKLPNTVIVVKVKEAYIHCSRALVRADVWNPAKHAAPGTVPTFGAMLEAHVRVCEGATGG